MKVRQCGQNEKVIRAKLIENNSLSARDWQNQSKLSNLMNLSQFNFNDIIKKSEASHASAVSNKLTHRKSPSILNGSAISVVNQKQVSPTKVHGDGSKPKKNKSTKKHILSCNEILSMAKKREVWHQISLQPTKSHIFVHYGQQKIKRKFKKEILLSKNQNFTKSKNNSTTLFGVCTNQQGKPGTQKPEPLSNFNANYPLSMSHSYIAFSQKDSSLNNTANVLNKIDKKLSKSSQAKYSQLQSKLELIKMEHAATVIQKNWRGYLTRKLLLDYINNQENLLADRLSRIKAQKIEYENFQKMIPQCNKFWTHRHSDCPSTFSNMNENNKIKGSQNNSLFSEPISDASSLNDSQEYQRKTPVINGSLDENQVFQSILQYEQSFNVTSRERHNVEQYGVQKQQNESRTFKTNSTSKREQKVKKYKKLQIICQFNQVIQSGATNTAFSECLEQEINIQMMLSSFLQKLKSEVNVKLENLNKILKENLMKSLMQFDEMLSFRQKLKKIKTEVDSESEKFLQTIKNLLGQLPYENGSNNKLIKDANQDFIEQKSPQKYFQLEQVSKKLVANKKKSQEEGGENRSPVSEYFTIELPTEELSPFKARISSGLETLKTFLQNLHEQCLQEPENSSETGYLCKVLKKHSELGPENMMERCLIQMLVEMLTGQYMLQDLISACEILAESHRNIKQEDNVYIIFIQKWANEVEKWELGPIEEVSGNMEESADVTQRNIPIKKSRNFSSKQWLQEL